MSATGMETKYRKYIPVKYVNIKQYKGEEFIAVYADIYEAIEKTGLPYSNIYNNIRERIKTTHGFRFTGEKRVLPRKTSIQKNKDYKSLSLANAKGEKQERSCLMCGKKFLSRGIHNRRCLDCNNKVEHDRAYDIPSPAKCWADGKNLANFKESYYPFQTSDL